MNTTSDLENYLYGCKIIYEKSSHPAVHASVNVFKD